MSTTRTEGATAAIPAYCRWSISWFLTYFLIELSDICDGEVLGGEGGIIKRRKKNNAGIDCYAYYDVTHQMLVIY